MKLKSRDPGFKDTRIFRIEEAPEDLYRYKVIERGNIIREN